MSGIICSWGSIPAAARIPRFLPVSPALTALVQQQQHSLSKGQDQAQEGRDCPRSILVAAAPVVAEGLGRGNWPAAAGRREAAAAVE